MWRWAGFLLSLASVPGGFAETGHAAWLRYAPVDEAAGRSLPAVIVAAGDSPVVGSARAELIRGVKGLFGRTLRIAGGLPGESAILVGALSDLRKLAPQLALDATLAPDAFWLKTVRSGTARYLVIAGGSDRGALYGAFALLRRIATGEPVTELDQKQAPYAPARWVNEWDNLDGSIERGYGGRSIFWENGHARTDLTSVSDYARLLASVGINGCSINNVNADRRVISPEYLPEVARIAAAMRPWGVRIAVSIDFGSPRTLGNLDTFDPLDARVIAWWKDTVNRLYSAVPDLGGIVIKADSEGRVGPSAYGRTHADAANVVAGALAPHGGLVFYRGFVYDHRMDWTNLKLDRARAADDNFRPLDGKFLDNVLIQIKHGPIDFQVREPASPLFGTLEKTNEAIELQITQEYFGQAQHLVYLVPYWKEALDFDLRAAAEPTPVKALAAGKTFHRPAGGFVGVANVGLDDNWAGNHNSMANLYGFGRLAWDPDMSARRIIDEWSKQTFGTDPKVVETVSAINLASWRAYEDYTGPLGLQTLTDIVGNHYGVAVEASERNGWGQWHRADEKGVGMDRTVATGTGYTGQYRSPVARMYESLATCPDELLLFFHHVPYTYKLHEGRTVIQYLYDAHYAGAEAVAGWVKQWQTMKGRVDDQRYADVLAQLEYQAGQAIVWRDAVNDWFHRASGIADAKGRVGRHPGRTEAEAMQLEGYTVRDVVPWEGASGGKGVACAESKCAAGMKFTGEAGWYTISVEYFDQMNGASRFRLLVGAQAIDEWVAGRKGVPARKMDSSASTRRVITGVALRPGDEIRIEGVPDGGEPAGLDYVEIQKGIIAP
ncbi:MAG: glucosiduronase [Acidobacteria bacterium]|nr:glucosiduronase [Acidobacteriota bacterium]